MQSDSVELFGRRDTPWNVFVSGSISAGHSKFRAKELVD
jgi:hypothetical protein